jgi:hypothetical protein
MKLIITAPRGEVQGRLPIREGPNHARGAPPDLSQDAVERIFGADAPPVLLREGVVGQHLLDRRPHELPGRPERRQLLDHSDSLFSRGECSPAIGRLRQASMVA